MFRAHHRGLGWFTVSYVFFDVCLVQSFTFLILKSESYSTSHLWAKFGLGLPQMRNKSVEVLSEIVFFRLVSSPKSEILIWGFKFADLEQEFRHPFRSTIWKCSAIAWEGANDFYRAWKNHLQNPDLQFRFQVGPLKNRFPASFTF